MKKKLIVESSKLRVKAAWMSSPPATFNCQLSTRIRFMSKGFDSRSLKVESEEHLRKGFPFNFQLLTVNFQLSTPNRRMWC